MQTETMADGERLRNPMTIRFRDDDFRKIGDEAWKRRQSVSSLVRETVLAAVRAQAGEAAQ
jgi:hypothetical protein